MAFDLSEKQKEERSEQFRLATDVKWQWAMDETSKITPDRTRYYVGALAAEIATNCCTSESFEVIHRKCQLLMALAQQIDDQILATAS